MAIRAAIREPQRPLVFALAVLIHVGLFQLLMSPRHTTGESTERRTVLVFLPDPQKDFQRTPRQVAPLAPETSGEQTSPPRAIGVRD